MEVGTERAAARKRPRAALAGACRVARAAGGGKDRHSKVVTSRGLRDRRVRLSVPTAIQFYDIQDRLGVDQPSKAVAWLIRAAAAAIDALPSLDCSSFAPSAAPSPPSVPAEGSTSETSKGSGLSLASAPAETAPAQQTSHAYSRSAVGGGAFPDLLHCSASDGRPMQQQPTLAYYPAAQPPSSHVTPGMPFETFPQLAFLQEQQQHPVVVGGTLQSNNAVVAARLWPPPHRHPYLMQRFASAPADTAALPFFLGGGAAPATSTADRGLQLWDFKQQRKP